MNETYSEALVKARPTAKTMAIKSLLIMLVVMSAFFVIFMGQLIWLPVAALITIVSIYLFPRFNHIEYEYIYCDGQIDFDRIAAGAKRKTMLRVDMENVEIVAPLGSHHLDNFKNTAAVKDFSSGNPKKTFVLVTNKQDKLLKILFEPTDRMIDGMYFKAPSKVKKNI